MTERQQGTSGEPGTRQPWLEFDVHGRVGIRVAADAPTAELLAHMLAAFRTTRPLTSPHITVTGRRPRLAGGVQVEDLYRFTDRAVHLLRHDVLVERTDDGFAIHGRGELLTTLLPVLDIAMTAADAPMIHAATFRIEGVGIAMPAWGGVGKTSTVAKVARLPHAAFMGDDWAFIDRDGTLLGYAKPMYIKPHHRPIYPHLFSRRHKPLVPPSLSRPLARATTALHPLVVRYPRLAASTRRWSPEHLTVTAEEALPGVPIATRAPLGEVVFVERLDRKELERRDTTPAWMADRLVGNFHAELPTTSRDVLTALSATGLVPLHGFLHDKTDRLSAALDGLEQRLLRIPSSLSPDDASDLITEDLAQRHVTAVAS